jgi:hypothetical protein
VTKKRVEVRKTYDGMGIGRKRRTQNPTRMRRRLTAIYEAKSVL